MIHRLLRPSRASSFFIFGARGTGKSYFIKNQFNQSKTMYFDLLDPALENQFARSPETLENIILAEDKKPHWVVLDEIQKNPKLLNVVHRLIENHQIKFCLTGSSARKLKRGFANLLAGRAFVYQLFPFSYLELGDQFELSTVLQWGCLPKIYNLKTSRDRKKFLEAYALVYLKEEVIAEQLVRKLDPFRLFLPIVGQMSGKILNFSKIAGEVGSDTKTIQKYFQILEETHMGFILPAFNLSIRKSQKSSPKFYLFDIGVKRALDETLDLPLRESTALFGVLFEHFVILEIQKMNAYKEKNYKLSYFATSNGGEVDLVLSKRNQYILIEIKSSPKIDPVEVKKLSVYRDDFQKKFQVPVTAYYISRDPFKQKLHQVKCVPWQESLSELF